MFSSITESYEQLWKSIIRPPREEYSDLDLGPRRFNMDRKTYIRTDFSIVSCRGCRIQASHFEPVDEERGSEILPCVVYLHGNSSSRLEGFVLAPLMLPMQATVVCFDWAGCGKSEGQYITLGWNERHDLDIMIRYLRANRRVGCIGLWGRSMGAVSALFSACNNLDICSMVLDSPFTSMEKLAYELARKHSSAPGFFLKFVYNKIRDTIEEKAGFDLSQLNPINLVKNCLQPAFFITGKNDDFVLPHHTQDLYQEYAGDKDIIYVDGDHNSPRPKICLGQAAKFFYSTLLMDRIPKRIRSIRKKKYKPKEIESEEAMLKWAIDQSLREFDQIRGSV